MIRRSGETSRTHESIGTATMRVVKRTGLTTARVLGVTSPNSNTSETITRIPTIPARSGPYKITKMPAAFTVAAMLINSLPVRIEMISLRG